MANPRKKSETPLQIIEVTLETFWKISTSSWEFSLSTKNSENSGWDEMEHNFSARSTGKFQGKKWNFWKGSPVFPLEIFRWNCEFHLRVSQRFLPVPGRSRPYLKALVNEDTLLPMMFLGLRKLGNICCGHKMFLNKIRNIFCVPDTKFVSATMCPRLPGPSAKQQREMTKFYVVWRTWTTTAIFLKFYFKLIAVSQIQFCDNFDSDKQSKWL